MSKIDYPFGAYDAPKLVYKVHVKLIYQINLIGLKMHMMAKRTIKPHRFD